eukprot:TRINITY_DN1607_c2_g1_i1.p1 TRINITY_DN1607_c2_g1~~TRINITY_DN1607_c2_g1_i1.p1  ORF type:complete len:513 (+),score=95.72 TRINITY_DN1607_c2_g1_i1:131-1669(+)
MGLSKQLQHCSLDDSLLFLERGYIESKKRSNSCPPSIGDIDELEGLESPVSIITSTADNVTTVALPSLVDDRESDSCCSSFEGSSQPSRLNAGAAAFVPACSRQPLQQSQYYDAAAALFHTPDDTVIPHSAITGFAIQGVSSPEGSKVIQRSLPLWSPDEIDDFFVEIKSHITYLMTETVGSYIIQRLVECATPKIRKGLGECLKGNMMELSLQPFACRMVQKVLEVVDSNDCFALAKELDGQIPRFVQDQHGNHVVQKLIDLMPYNSDFIVASFVGRVHEVATHSYGCRVVQRVLEKCRESPQIVQVLEEILFHVQSLVVDQYGNYVVQHVVKHGHPQYQLAITSKLSGKYGSMATHKFASNVIEKMLETVESSRVSVLEEMMLPSASDDSISVLAMAAMDPFGNYVVQKLLDLSADQQKRSILEHLSTYLSLLSRSHHAKNLQQRIKTFISNPYAPPSSYIRKPTQVSTKVMPSQYVDQFTASMMYAPDVHHMPPHPHHHPVPQYMQPGW